MSRYWFACALAALALLLGSAVVSAQQSGTAAEAKAMLDRAIAALKADEVKALVAFNDKGNKDFHDRDLYVFCTRMSDGIFTAHVNPTLLGTDGRAVKIKDDPVGQRVYDTIKDLAPGNVATVQYRFPKPGTATPVLKESFVTRVGDQGCGVGYYK